MRRAAVATLILAAACGGGEVPGPAGRSPPAATDQALSEIRVSSTAFADGRTIPVEFTCDGENVSPPLAWAFVPEETAELHLIVEDPDAPGGTFTHWNVTGIPSAPDQTGWQHVARASVPRDGTQQPNDLGDGPYGGPCPPPGDEPHRYIFIVRALDADGTVLGEGVLTGLYGR